MSSEWNRKQLTIILLSSIMMTAVFHLWGEEPEPPSFFSDLPNTLFPNYIQYDFASLEGIDPVVIAEKVGASLSSVTPYRLTLAGYQAYEQELYDDAVILFLFALKEDPHYFLAEYNIGCCLSMMNDPSRYRKAAYYLVRSLYQSSERIDNIHSDMDLLNIRNSEWYTIIIDSYRRHSLEKVVAELYSIEGLVIDPVTILSGGFDIARYFYFITEEKPETVSVFCLDRQGIVYAVDRYLPEDQFTFGISGDQEMIVYSAYGTLWLYSGESGTLSQLTRHPVYPGGYDTDPEFKSNFTVQFSRYPKGQVTQLIDQVIGEAESEGALLQINIDGTGERAVESNESTSFVRHRY